jgi:hypothetical protein
MLPEEAITHDHHAYLNSYQESFPNLIEVGPPVAGEAIA